MRLSLAACFFSLFLAVGCGRNNTTLQEDAAQADANLTSKIEGFWKVKSVTFSGGKDHDVTTQELREFNKGQLTGIVAGEKAWGAAGGYSIKDGIIHFKNNDGTPRKTAKLETVNDQRLVLRWLKPDGQPVTRGFLKTTFARLSKEAADKFIKDSLKK